ncbi:MAG: hypothetical protein MUF13_15190, partial [Akkermansiaceae bacterium]|nr:hypothetical protein [Akkermansiaceae bacterium]
MSRHDFQIPVTFKHRVVFTWDAFAPDQMDLAEILREGGGRRALVMIEEAVAAAWPGLAGEAEAFFSRQGLDFRGIHVIPGGEAVKADDSWVRETWG